MTIPDDQLSVRIGKAADEDLLIGAMREMHLDNEWGIRHADGSPLRFSEPRARSFLRRALIPDHNNQDDEAWIGILGPIGRVWGSVYLSVGQVPCCEDRLIYEMWNWVLPDYRESNGARHLLSFATALAGVMQMPLVIGVMSHVRTEAKRRLYERALRTPAMGAVFLYHHAGADNDLTAAETARVG
jgi:hypothetical protein